MERRDNVNSEAKKFSEFPAWPEGVFNSSELEFDNGESFSRDTTYRGHNTIKLENEIGHQKFPDKDSYGNEVFTEPLKELLVRDLGKKLGISQLEPAFAYCHDDGRISTNTHVTSYQETTWDVFQEAVQDSSNCKAVIGHYVLDNLVGDIDYRKSDDLRIYHYSWSDGEDGSRNLWNFDKGGSFCGLGRIEDLVNFFQKNPNKIEALYSWQNIEAQARKDFRVQLVFQDPDLLAEYLIKLRRLSNKEICHPVKNRINDFSSIDSRKEKSYGQLVIPLSVILIERKRRLVSILEKMQVEAYVNQARLL